MISINLPPLKKIINEKFIPIFYNRDRFLLLWGGRGSSKSNFAAKKLIHKCLTNKYFRCILIRDTYASIKDSQYQTIKDIIYEWGLQTLFTFRENPLEIHCKNGNIFYARGCDNVDKIKSIKDPSDAWYEEGNNIKQSDFFTITTSIRTGKADYLQEIFSFNPECDGDPADFWIYKMFFQGKKSNSFSSKLEIEMPDGKVLETTYTSHHSTYHDNRWITPQFVAFLEQLKKLDPYYYDVFCLGIWGQRKGTNPFALQYEKIKHESTKAVFDPNKQLLIKIDFNLNPFAVNFSHKFRDIEGEHFHTVDEGSIENGSIDGMIDFIGDRYGNSMHSCFITGDAMGKKRDQGQKDLASYYIRLQRAFRLKDSQLQLPANPFHKNSRSDVNFVLYNFPDYKINPVKAPETCRDMVSVQCDAFGDILKKNRNDLTQRADFLDCERYGVNTFLRKWIDSNMKFKK